MNLKSLLIVVPCALFSVCLFAQKKKKGDNPNLVAYKYGDIKPDDFSPTVYPLDSAATAIILANVGTADFVGNSNGGFSIEYKEQKRIRLLNKSSFMEEATVQIPLYYKGTDEEKLIQFEAITYNIENGKVVATKLSKSDLFSEKYNDHIKLYKFTFPNIKEGSIIEYKYVTSSPFIFSLQPWTFQHDIPTLWSDYQATIPASIYDYMVIRKGYLPYVLDTATTSRQSYNITYQNGVSPSDNQGFSASTITGHWAIKDIPALKKEPYMSCLEDYRSKISFQLRHYIHGSGYNEDILGTWQQLAEKMLKREDFGEGLDKNNGWLSGDVKSAIDGKSTSYEKAKAIYEYVRDNYTSNADQGLYLTSTLKKVYQDKAGNVADINLLLTAAMKNAGFIASPVILSTRSHGKANEVFPLIEQYNYVICRVMVDNNYYLLDATQKFLDFGKLSSELYNTSARVMDAIPELVSLSPDSLKESKVTTMFIMNDADHKLSASVSHTAGASASLALREKLSKQSQESYFKELKTAYTGDVEISNEGIDSLRLLNNPVKVKYDLKMSLGDEDMIYFNPMLAAQEKDNPFAAAERVYPVEIPYCRDEIYILNMQVPEGYTVDELPKSARVKLNESEGMFEYIIAKSGDNIQMRSHLKLEKALFEPDDYQILRDFYAFVVKKEAEQIVFKKVK